jgi:hypothetical protein
VRRARHRLDLLPLLDVFMVVLFVFATIQEETLDQTTRDALAREAKLVAERDRLVEELRESEARPRDDATLRAKVGELEEKLASTEANARDQLARAGVGDEAVRRDSVLAKLLDNYSVFEIEIAGSLDETGAVVNHCCYRTDPLATKWQTCGTIPADAQARSEWWEQGGGGLATTLRRTKGGNAMTIVRQDRRAGYRMAARLEELLRDHLPEHKVYDEGVGVLEIHCAI